MAITVEDLVFQPFKEVIERGKEATANAEANISDDYAKPVSDMMRSARALVKEGERAFRRLMPLWMALVEKYGDDFTEALRPNIAILESQRLLDDLLYDLEDFVQVETFTCEKFSAVKAASKAFGLTLLETIIRIRICHTCQSPSETKQTGSSADLHEVKSPISSQPTDSTRARLARDGGDSRIASIRDRRASSPDILGAERGFLRLVTNVELFAQEKSSRTSDWVDEQAMATDYWERTHSPMPECDPHIIGKDTDSLMLCETRATESDNAEYGLERIDSRLSWYTNASYVSSPRSTIYVPASRERTTSLAWSRLSPVTGASTRDELPHQRKRPSIVPLTPDIYGNGLMLVSELDQPQTSSSGASPVVIDPTSYIDKRLCHHGSQALRSGILAHNFI
ncbi:hypothetical protein F4778DRAFT_780768 [Xylariomycetidae sp. FL2044]|nr:hypothetical protein F4778DRAFT_780768 [Xylariomycetidae sp. FL2044]